MNFSTATQVLNNHQHAHCNNNLVIAVGISNRGQNFTSSVLPDLRKMKNALINFKATNTYVMGISYGQLLKPEEITTIKLINDKLHNIYGKKGYIPQLPTPDTIVQPHDIQNIHYNQDTINNITNKMLDHLNITP